jgi:hypothetical protein
LNSPDEFLKKVLKALILTCFVSATQLATNRSKNGFSQREFLPEWSQKARSESHCLPPRPKTLNMRLSASSFVNEARRFGAKNGRLQLKASDFHPRQWQHCWLPLSRFVFLICCVCEGGDVGAANPYAPPISSRINIGTQQPSGVAASQNIILSNLMHLLLPQTNQPTICHPNAAVIEFYLTRAPPTSFLLR